MCNSFVWAYLKLLFYRWIIHKLNNDFHSFKWLEWLSKTNFFFHRRQIYYASFLCGIYSGSKKTWTQGLKKKGIDENYKFPNFQINNKDEMVTVGDNF